MKIVCSVPIQEKRWSFSLWKFKFESVVETCVHIRKSHNHATDENGHSIFSVYWPLVFGEGIVWLGTPVIPSRCFSVNVIMTYCINLLLTLMWWIWIVQTLMWSCNWCASHLINLYPLKINKIMVVMHEELRPLVRVLYVPKYRHVLYSCTCTQEVKTKRPLTTMVSPNWIKMTNAGIQKIYWLTQSANFSTQQYHEHIKRCLTTYSSVLPFYTCSEDAYWQ